MTPLHYLLIMLIGLGAAFVQRVSGFGLGIFTMMFLPHLLPSHTAAASISCLFSCCITAYNAIKYRRSISVKTALPMLLAAMLSIPVAVHFAAMVTARTFELLLGSVLILLSLYFLIFNKSIRIRPTPLSGVIAGMLSGTLNGLFSTGGPPAVLYLTSASPDNITYFATIQFYFCLTNIYSTATRALNGQITREVLIFSAIGFIGCLIGDALGKLVFDKLNAKKLKAVIYIAMLISGALMIL